MFLTASAVGYYGYDEGDRTFTESGPQGKGFLAEVTRVWEAEANKLAGKRVRRADGWACMWVDGFGLGLGRRADLAGRPHLTYPPPHKPHWPGHPRGGGALRRGAEQGGRHHQEAPPHLQPRRRRHHRVR